MEERERGTFLLIKVITNSMYSRFDIELAIHCKKGKYKLFRL